MSLYIDTLESQIKNWLKDPKAGSNVAGRNWLGLCQALMYQLCAKFGTAKVVYNPATQAMKASGKLNTDPAKAPVGAFHYWRYMSGGSDKGHVVFDLAGGGTRVLTASSYASPQWGKNAGVSSVARINQALGKSNYLGWAMSNGKNTAPVLERPEPVAPTPIPEPEPEPVIPNPEPEPEIEEKPEMPNLETPAINSKSILFTPTVRAWIYDIYSILAISMLFISGGLSAAGLLAPIWVAFIMGGLVAISAWVTSLARSNLEK